MSDKYLKLRPSNVISGKINLPGSKSISNRVLLISSMAQGKIKINNLLFSEDTKVMILALKKLGIKVEENEALKECSIIGSENLFPKKKANLYIGNAGTVIRPLTAALAFNEGKYTLHGTTRMHERPIADLVNSLNSIGAKIDYINNKGYPPLFINGSKVKKNKIKIKGNISSQFLTSILIASPILSKNNKLEIEVVGKLISKPYIDLTIKLLKSFGLIIEQNEHNTFIIPAKQIFKSPKEITIEGDASSATYFLAAAAISGKLLRVEGINNNSIQGDINFIDILKKMGANIKTGNNWIEVDSISQLKAIDADFNHIPDAAMTVAILALYAKNSSILRNIGSWRVKETDRLSAMSKELTKLGAKVTEGKNFLKIEPPLNLNSATIDTYNDHRMAMCFSLASLNSKYKKGANIIINDPNCVAKTFPNYFEIFKNILN